MAAAPAVDGDYLELRRALHAEAVTWRVAAPAAMTVVFGPPRPADEGAGALGQLDAALATGDETNARRAREQIRGALSLAALSFSRPDATALARAASDAAYDLGLMALEATPGTPNTPEAVRADLEGTLDGIAAALGWTPPSLARLRARISRGLVDRGAFVLETGRLGAEIRARVPTVRPPIRPRAETAIISAFTLPAPRVAVDERAADLGKRLFFDRRLSRGGKRSCASCHRPERALSDGRAVPESLDPAAPLSRNTPTLLYSPLHAALLWDGRHLTHEAQALGVIHARAEMGLSSKELAAAVGISEREVGIALAAHQARDLVPGTAPIDRFARGDERALSRDERAGLDVLAGKGRCARCHVPPLFGGSRPSDFAVPVFAVLGVPARDRRRLDDDRGRAAVTGLAADRGAFKTPTLRNLARTAPYMHNGAFRSLEEVIDFYDRGGGRALGFTVENQDPDVRPLSLSREDKRVLSIFLRSALADR